MTDHIDILLNSIDVSSSVEDVMGYLTKRFVDLPGVDEIQTIVEHAMLKAVCKQAIQIAAVDGFFSVKREVLVAVLDHLAGLCANAIKIQGTKFVATSAPEPDPQAAAMGIALTSDDPIIELSAIVTDLYNRKHLQYTISYVEADRRISDSGNYYFENLPDQG